MHYVLIHQCSWCEYAWKLYYYDILWPILLYYYDHYKYHDNPFFVFFLFPSLILFFTMCALCLFVFVFPTIFIDYCNNEYVCTCDFKSFQIKYRLCFCILLFHFMFFSLLFKKKIMCIAYDLCCRVWYMVPLLMLMLLLVT